MGKSSDINNQTSATLSCNFTNPESVVKGHHWEKNKKIIGGTKKDGSDLYIEYTYVLITLINQSHVPLCEIFIILNSKMEKHSR